MNNALLEEKDIPVEKIIKMNKTLLPYQWPLEGTKKEYSEIISPLLNFVYIFILVFLIAVFYILFPKIKQKIFKEKNDNKIKKQIIESIEKEKYLEIDIDLCKKVINEQYQNLKDNNGDIMIFLFAILLFYFKRHTIGSNEKNIFQIAKDIDNRYKTKILALLNLKEHKEYNIQDVIDIYNKLFYTEW